MERDNPEFAVIGLATMGRNLALNIAEHGFSTAVWNVEPAVTEEFLAKHPQSKLSGSRSLTGLVATLQQPRCILMMIRAGQPVDEVLAQLLPLLESGDILVDCGNSHFKDTERRQLECLEYGVQLVGMGVSGGEHGARHGPSLMPGGAPSAWQRLQPMLSAIAATTASGSCVTHVGPGGAGHFVKMVHNGIEYGAMQLIAEIYAVATRLGYDAEQIADVFDAWNQGPLASFLVELTARVLRVKDPESGAPLVELIQDRAEQKGTGRWTLESALELGVAVPTISAAVDARLLSSLKDERMAASNAVRRAGPSKLPEAQSAELRSALPAALFASKLCSYAQGFQLLRAANAQYGWEISLEEVARIWTGGCILRAKLLDEIRRAYGAHPDLPHLFLEPHLEEHLHASQPAWRRCISQAQKLGISVPGLSASLAYFDAYRSARLPQNLIQAQRDAFGAHTYERLDRPDLGPVHTDWFDD